MTRGARLLATLGAVTLAGCVLFVNDLPDGAGHCRFQGDASTACGACIADSCSTLVDACCRDDTCRSTTLPYLDGCSGSGDAAACSLLSSPTSVLTTLGLPDLSSLRACIASSCASKCAGVTAAAPGTDAGTKTDGGDAGGLGRSPNVACSGSTDSCSCSWSPSSPNRTPCTQDTVENGVCCGNFGWPDRGLDCACRRFACKQTADGCSCSTYTNGPLSKCSLGTNCCVSSSGSTCECRSRACDSFERKVAECNRDQMGCGSTDEGKTSACAR